jgi:hypothetical protein
LKVSSLLKVYDITGIRRYRFFGSSTLDKKIEEIMSAKSVLKKAIVPVEDAFKVFLPIVCHLILGHDKLCIKNLSLNDR